MADKINHILTVNGGSSSIKFSIYSHEKVPERLLSGKIERVGQDNPVLSFTSRDGKKTEQPLPAGDTVAAVNSLITWLEHRTEFQQVVAIGQRIVHGMHITAPQVVDDALLKQLESISPYDPDHLPGEIQLIRAFREKLPGIQQIACFDTAFHKTLPRLATRLPIPRRFDEQGIRKYGFHGLSYSYIVQALVQQGEPCATRGSLIIAHLGNGASLAAVKDGKSIETSMGFTPVAGLVMGTRSGDLDPGLCQLIMKKESMSPEQFNDFINHDCGLLGISGNSSDMQELLRLETTDTRAAEAVNIFCYQVKKWIGSFVTVLEGLDVLVFTGGIGENAPAIRYRICAGLEFMGVELDAALNQAGAGIISTTKSKIKVLVIPTDEELMIATLVSRLISK